MIQKSCDFYGNSDPFVLFQQLSGYLSLVCPMGDHLILVKIVREIDDLPQCSRLFHLEHRGKHILFRLGQISDPLGQEIQFPAIFLLFIRKPLEPSSQVRDGCPCLLDQHWFP